MRFEFFKNELRNQTCYFDSLRGAEKDFGQRPVPIVLLLKLT